MILSVGRVRPLCKIDEAVRILMALLRFSKKREVWQLCKFKQGEVLVNFRVTLPEKAFAFLDQFQYSSFAAKIFAVLQIYSHVLKLRDSIHPPYPAYTTDYHALMSCLIIFSLTSADGKSQLITNDFSPLNNTVYLKLKKNFLGNAKGSFPVQTLPAFYLNLIFYLSKLKTLSHIILQEKQRYTRL